jgi:predicted nucleic acid-binding protein
MQKSLKQKTVILDSSVWIAYLYTQDAHHQRALEVVNKYENHIILMPEIVYFETLIGIYKVSGDLPLVKSCLYLFKTHIKIHICKIRRSKIENLIINHLELIKLKSSDFQILMYVINYNPSILITFDKKLKREYSKLAFNKNVL